MSRSRRKPEPYFINAWHEPPCLGRLMCHLDTESVHSTRTIRCERCGANSKMGFQPDIPSVSTHEVKLRGVGKLPDSGGFYDTKPVRRKYTIRILAKDMEAAEAILIQRLQKLLGDKTPE